MVEGIALSGHFFMSSLKSRTDKVRCIILLNTSCGVKKSACRSMEDFCSSTRKRFSGKPIFLYLQLLLDKLFVLCVYFLDPLVYFQRKWFYFRRTVGIYQWFFLWFWIQFYCYTLFQLESVSGSPELYKVHICYENLLGSTKSS